MQEGTYNVPMYKAVWKTGILNRSHSALLWSLYLDFVKYFRLSSRGWPLGCLFWGLHRNRKFLLAAGKQKLWLIKSYWYVCMRNCKILWGPEGEFFFLSSCWFSRNPWKLSFWKNCGHSQPFWWGHYMPWQ